MSETKTEGRIQFKGGRFYVDGKLLGRVTADTSQVKELAEKAVLAEKLGDGWQIASTPDHYLSLVAGLEVSRRLVEELDRETTFTFRGRRFPKPDRFLCFNLGVMLMVLVTAIGAAFR